MKNIKKFIAGITIVGIIGIAGAAYAVSVKTPAEIISELTGKKAEDVYKERTDGKTFGAVAKEAGKFDEFKTQMIEQKKAVLDKRVEDGSLTQEKADEIYSAIKANQAACDGTGSVQVGKKYGIKFGAGKGQCSGNGTGCGRGINR